MDSETPHAKAIEAAARAARATSGGQPFSWENAARDAVSAFLANVAVTDATVAAVQRAEQWSTFWSPDDAAALIRAAVRQLQTDI